jgi:hypothetical protein
VSDANESLSVCHSTLSAVTRSGDRTATGIPTTCGRRYASSCGLLRLQDSQQARVYAVVSGKRGPDITDRGFLSPVARTRDT